MTTLNPAQGVKPLDFGKDGITGSVDENGGLIALNAFHLDHGYVTLTTAFPFAEDKRYDPQVVRRYRESLARLNGFGPRFESGIVQCEARLLDDAIPQIRLMLQDGGQAEVTTFAHAGGVIQIWDIKGTTLRWGGHLSLQRCAYTQLTEGGPLPPVDAQNRAMFAVGVLVIENPALGFAAAVVGLPDQPVWEKESAGLVTVDPVAGQAGTTILTIGLGSDAASAREHAQQLAQIDAWQTLATQRREWQTLWQGIPDNRLLRRGLVYGCMMAIPVGKEMCILTDHMLLPLSWNRDAYYVARALLTWKPALADRVQRHLIWLFEQADRPDGYWARCYLANGAVKDRAFQLDQQIFPVLELLDYVDTTGEQAMFDRVRRHIGPILAFILSQRTGDEWLFPTDETPADDPIALPYHFSSHVLLWYTLRRLAERMPGEGLADLAEQIRAATLKHFVAEKDGTHIFAYATDGHGNHYFYHDANDFPTVLAPGWGFVAADDPVWQATLDFAFSKANEGGYYAPGLGSVHTRAPWSLGDVQELIVARTTGNAEREHRVMVRLEQAACWDGALPEAYDAETYEVISRHWFAWPGAVLACVLLNVWD